MKEDGAVNRVNDYQDKSTDESEISYIWIEDSFIAETDKHTYYQALIIHHKDWAGVLQVWW